MEAHVITLMRTFKFQTLFGNSGVAEWLAASQGGHSYLELVI
jgi:hypothetical protein